jgi:transcriptional regulator with XRE-family HTH domain
MNRKSASRLTSELESGPTVSDATLSRASGTLGLNLRRLRKARAWTLAQTAAKCGISIATLSKVENDQLSLTFANLLKVSNGFQVEISELFTASEHDSGVYPVVTHLGQGVLHETANYSHEYLCADLQDRRMVPLITRIKARSLAQFGPLLHHPGQEFVFVLQGAVDLIIEGRGPQPLRAGDSAYFDSGLSHAIVSADAAEAVVLSVLYPVGKVSAPDSQQSAALPEPAAGQPASLGRGSKRGSKSRSKG